MEAMFDGTQKKCILEISFQWHRKRKPGAKFIDLLTTKPNHQTKVIIWPSLNSSLVKLPG